MSQWQEQIRNHPVWQTLQDLGPAIDLVAARDGVDAVGLDLIDRFRTVPRLRRPSAFTAFRFSSSRLPDTRCGATSVNQIAVSTASI